ncbi:glycosyltransferase [Escherichia coli]|nr:glycosyltransferase [Escherichia coli]EGN0942015.1 glycosyltransferase [Escherichia coli]EIK7911773.1 glycosyltransferase [Escherichia coli]EJK7323856.1 glycosyltransferase [Escherichia coli]ELI5581210.1 glycosyltransferase [Escherichia coli]
MRILYTESSPNIGGQEIQSITQLIEMKKKGYQTLLACRKDSSIADEAQKHGINVVFIPFRNSLHFPSLLAIAKLMNKFYPNIVICHSGHDSNIIGIAKVLRIIKYDIYIIRQKTYLANNKRMFTLNYLCDKVVVPSESLKQDLLQHGCKNNISTINPGFNFNKLSNDLKQPLPQHVMNWLSLNEKYPVIVQAGMLRQEKGFHFMLNILSNMKRKGHKFRWLIAGTGAEEDSLRKAIVYNDMDDCVYMCGMLSPLTPVWRVASLMVMPSIKEPFGMVIVEAAACGVPVMASDVGGIPDIIQQGKNGTLLPPNDYDAWQKALCYFFNNPLHFRKLALQAQKDMVSRYNIELTVQKLTSIDRL